MKDRIAFTENAVADDKNDYLAARNDDRSWSSDWKNSDWLCDWLKLARERQSGNSN